MGEAHRQRTCIGTDIPSSQYNHFWLSALRLPHGGCGLTTCAPSPCGRPSRPPWWIVTSTTTMGTPFPWRSPSLGNPVFRHDETSRAQRRCLTHHLHEASLAPILPARIPRTATLFRVQKGSGCKRSARGRVLPSSVLEGEVDGQRVPSATDPQARFSSGVHADGRLFSFGFGRFQPSPPKPDRPISQHPAFQVCPSPYRAQCTLRYSL